MSSDQAADRADRARPGQLHRTTERYSGSRLWMQIRVRARSLAQVVLARETDQP